MKNVMVKLFAAVIVSMFALSVNTYAGTSKEVSFKSNMTCNGCKSAIMKSLKAENGVENIDANVETNIVKVTYDASKTDESKIAEKIKKAGYKADKTSCEDKKKDCDESECDGKKKASSEGKCCSSKNKKTNS